jgi:hypothetical protein
MARKSSVLVARVCPSCVKRAHAHVCRWVVVNVPGGTGRGLARPGSQPSVAQEKSRTGPPRTSMSPLASIRLAVSAGARVSRGEAPKRAMSVQTDAAFS